MIPGLDGLRAIAYMLVFFFHVKYLDVGWVGVQFFFVLSGFLITGILLDMKKSLPAGGYFLKFYGRRFLRIFPLYYFYLAIMALLVGWLISISYRPGWMELFNQQVWYAVFYVFDFHAATASHVHSYFLTHFWSLSVEEQFYIFWPLFLLLSPEKYYRRLFLGFIILGPVFRVFMLFVHNSGVLPMLAANPAEAIYPLPLTHIDAFAIGAYISRYSIPKAKLQFYILIGLVPLIGYAAQYYSTGDFGNILSLGYPLFMPDGNQFIWGYSLLNYFFAVTLQVIVDFGILNRFLEWPLLRYMGKISYGLYVYHLPVIWFSLDLIDLGFIDTYLVKPVSTIIAFLGTLLIASISYNFMERPLLQLKDRFFYIWPNQT